MEKQESQHAEGTFFEYTHKIHIPLERYERMLFDIEFTGSYSSSGKQSDHIANTGVSYLYVSIAIKTYIVARVLHCRGKKKRLKQR